MCAVYLSQNWAETAFISFWISIVRLIKLVLFKENDGVILALNLEENLLDEEIEKEGI